jgi:hypothetical protein
VNRFDDEESVANDVEPGVPGTRAQAANQGRPGPSQRAAISTSLSVFEAGRLIFSFYRGDDVVARYDIGVKTPPMTVGAPAETEAGAAG